MFHRLFCLILIAITSASPAIAAPLRILKPDTGTLVHTVPGGKPAGRVVPEYRPHEEIRPPADFGQPKDKPSSDWQPKPDAFDELLRKYEKNQQKPADKPKFTLPDEATPDTKKNVEKEVDDTVRKKCDDDSMKRNEC